MKMAGMAMTFGVVVAFLTTIPKIIFSGVSG
jgi:hypothetical protein